MRGREPEEAGAWLLSGTGGWGGRTLACLAVATPRSTNYRDTPEWGSLPSPSV